MKKILLILLLAFLHSYTLSGMTNEDRLFDAIKKEDQQTTMQLLQEPYIALSWCKR